MGIELSLEQMEQFRCYHRLLADWNTRVNLTSVAEWEEVRTRHLLDSLTVSLAVPRHLLTRGRFVDVGSGAGFPGVPLKIAFPRLSAALIESTAKKAAFLVALADTLGLTNVDVLTERAEALAHRPELREGFDFVLVRGVARMAVLSELTLPFCRLGGVVIAQKKPGIEEELKEAERSIEAMGGRLTEVRAVALEELGEVRALAVLEKVAPTPKRYPRRPGIPAKRPLRA